MEGGRGGEAWSQTKRAAISHRAFVEALSFAGLVIKELVFGNQAGMCVRQYGFPIVLWRL